MEHRDACPLYVRADLPAPTSVIPRRFELVRDVDVSGVSGTGHVADGVLFGSGLVVMHWRGEWPSLSMHPNLESVRAIHGHGGATHIAWID
jgi:hypothetical protein